MLEEGNSRPSPATRRAMLPLSYFRWSLPAAGGNDLYPLEKQTQARKAPNFFLHAVDHVEFGLDVACCCAPEPWFRFSSIAW